MNVTPIEWTDFSANPLKFRNAAGEVVWGCVHASPGCQHCYAEALAKRYGRGGPFNVPTMAGLTPFLDEKELHQMLTAKRIGGKEVAGSRCFVGDMTDIFGDWVSDELLDQLFAVFALRPDVTWQVLTKRAARMASYIQKCDASVRPGAPGPWADEQLVDRINSGIALHAGLPPFKVRARWPLPNVWLGVSCEDQQRGDERIPVLMRTPAAIRFVSAEPLLGPINFGGSFHPGWVCGGCVDVGAGITEYQSVEHEACRRCGSANPHNDTIHGIDWVIVGGESGGSARRCDVQWIRSIVEQCQAADVPVFTKQLGSVVIDRNDAGFTGDEPDHWPEVVAERDAVEHDLDGTRDGYQGAPVRVHLHDRKGGDLSEWPVDLRVREFPRSAVSA